VAAESVVDYVLTEHLVEKLALRNIDESLVHRVLRMPDQRFPFRAGRDVLQSKVVIHGKAYLLRVFVDIDRYPAEVVTVYQTSNIWKYWSEQK